jgi:hypothetical protein
MKKFNYEYFLTLSSDETEYYLMECFPIGTKVRFAEKEKKYTYYHNNLMEVVGISKDFMAFAICLLVSNYDNRLGVGHIHPNNLQIDIQENRRYKLEQLGI